MPALYAMDRGAARAYSQRPVNDAMQPGELAFLCVLAASSSFGAAARELGVTTAAVSKRLALIEGRLGVSRWSTARRAG